MDIDEISQEKAQRIWNNLKPFRGSVAAKSGRAKYQRKHLQVLTMMAWLEKKADTGE